MNSSLYLIVTKKIIALGIALHTLEYISLHHLFSESGIWRWSDIKTEHPFLKKLDFLFARDRHFLFLLWVRFFIATSLFIFPPLNIQLPILFLSTLALSLRFRGSFNGGSDYMTLLLLLVLNVEPLHPTEKMRVGILWYIALQSCSSYFIAGLVKIKQSDWRRGNALMQFIHSPNYNPPYIVKKIFNKKTLSFFCSWLVIIFELAFPFILLGGKNIALLGLSLGLLFHFINVFLFGLNRFLVIWMATYPAIYYIAATHSPH